MLELDLATSACRYLRIHTRCRTEAWEKVEAVAGAGLSNRAVFITRAYTAGGVAHALSLRVLPAQREPEPSVDLSLTFTQPVTHPREPGLSTSRVEDVLGLLASANQSLVFDCAARFVEDRARRTTIIPLPLKSDDWKGMPFDDISGFRFRKREADKTVYSVIMEAIDTELHVFVAYKWEAPLSVDLAGAVLKAGGDIARKFAHPSTD
ncbi:hypothetical protein FJY70_00455 [candidate division WOR-3 bacterium]|nr:hypothetical protein [candidate division WOR-3 bacterium]